jgi:hypothetical protein
MFVDAFLVSRADDDRVRLAVEISTVSVKIELACDLFLLLCKYTLQKAPSTEVFRMGDGKGGALNFCEVKSGLLNNM